MKKVSIIKCWLFVLFLLFFAVSSLNLSFLHFRYELEKMKVESNNQLTNSVASTFLNSFLTNPASFNDFVSLADKFNKDKKQLPWKVLDMRRNDIDILPMARKDNCLQFLSFDRMS